MKKKMKKRKERKGKIKNKAKLYTKEQEERQENTTDAASSQAQDTRHTERQHSAGQIAIIPSCLATTKASTSTRQSCFERPSGGQKVVHSRNPRESCPERFFLARLDPVNTHRCKDHQSKKLPQECPSRP